MRTFILFGIFFVFESYLVQAQSEKAATVVALSGKVLVRKESEKDFKNARSIKMGESIFTSDVINTASDSFVKLLFTDRSIVDLGPSSLFKIDDYQLKKGSDRKVLLSLPYGRIRTSVNSKVGPSGSFKLKTKAATMGVRGTEFVIDSPENGSITTTVTEGTVVMQNAEGKVQPLTQGQQARIDVPALPKDGEERAPASSSQALSSTQVSTVSKAELSSIRQNSVVPDQTFQKMIDVNKEGSGTLTQLSAQMRGLSTNINDEMIRNILENVIAGVQTPPPPVIGGHSRVEVLVHVQ